MGDTLTSTDKDQVKEEVLTSYIASNNDSIDIVPEDSIEKLSETSSEDCMEKSLETDSEDSVICIDSNDEPAVPLEDLAPVSEAISNDIYENNEEEDLSIVYEKISPPSEVQIMVNIDINNTISKQRKKRKNITTVEDREDNSVAANEEVNAGSSTSDTFDDSVCFVGEYEVPPLPKLSSRSAIQRPAPDSEERKKCKIECGICFDGKDEITVSGRSVVSTICGHIFCDNCIKQAIKATKQCPQCRKKLNLKQYHPIYF